MIRFILFFLFQAGMIFSLVLSRNNFSFTSLIFSLATSIIHELFDNGTDFQGQENYITNPSTPPLLSMCYTEILLGGDGIFDDTSSFERIATLPTHYRLVFSFNLGIIDQCENKSFNLYIDDVLIYSFISLLMSNIPCTSVIDQTGIAGCAIFLSNNIVISVFIYLQGSLCGSTPNGDTFYSIAVAMEHASTTAKVFMNVTGNANIGSWGINNLFLYIVDPAYACSGSCVNCVDGVCNNCSLTSQYEELSFCVNSCSSGYQTNATLHACYVCHSSCLTCNGDGPSSCLSCIPGEYVSSGNSCLICDTSCATCGGGLNTNCISCNTGKFLYHSTCISSCPTATFQDTSSSCADCTTGCSICSSLVSCSACTQNYYLTGAQCLSCNPSCLTCNGGLNTNCLTCTAGSRLYHGTCISSCPAATFQDTISSCADCAAGCSICSSLASCSACTQNYYISGVQCLSCDVSCLTCNGGLGTNCLSCNTNGLLYHGTCIASCPAATFQITISSCADCPTGCSICSNLGSCSGCTVNYYLSGVQCLACDPSCLTCNGGLINSCLSCNTGKLLYHSACISSCPAATFQDTIISCADCSAGCSTCSSLVSCSACIPNYYLSGATCLSCNPTCMTCSGGLINNCLTCNSESLLYHSTCISNCPAATFQDTIISCADCTSGCSTCSSLVSCSACTQNYYISGVQCLSCDPSCLTCNGGLNTNCLSCYTGFLIYHSTCIYSCPAATFQDTILSCADCTTGCSTCSSLVSCSTCTLNYYISGVECLSCNPSCLSCNGGLINNCLTCFAGSLLYHSTCISSCPASTFQDSSSSCADCTTGCSACSSLVSCSACTQNYYLFGAECLSCNPSCLTCNGGSDDNCLSCNTGSIFYKSACIASCPAAKFKDTSTSCADCPTGCSTCSSLVSCSACAQNYYLFGIQCLSCNPTCLTCNGGLNTNCLTCNVGSLLYYSSCISSCPSATFQDTISSCADCPTGCSICSSLVSCSACSQNYDLSGLQCYSICPSNAYFNVSLSQCILCDNSCLTCSNSGSSSCNSCDSTFGLYLNVGSCVSTCPLGKFPNSLLNICSFCDISCETCFNASSNDCLSCPSDKFLNSNNSCVESCPLTYYADYNQNQCFPCDPSCSTCNGASFSNCTSCTTDSMLNSQNQCQQNCSEGFYFDSTQKTCVTCVVSCKTCFGGLGNQCLTCSTGALYQNTCVLTTPNHTFLDIATNSYLDCDAICEQCYASGQSYCLSCYNGTFFNRNSCFNSCPLGTTENDQTNSCDEPPELFSMISSMNNPYDILINFYPDAYPSKVYQNLIQNISVNILGSSQSTYSYYAQNSLINNTLFVIHVSYYENYTYKSTNTMKITVNNNDPFVNYQGSNDLFQLNDLTGCSSSEFYDQNSSACNNKEVIDYNWKYTVWPNSILIKFSDEINEGITYAISNNLLVFSIPSLNTDEYSYSLLFDNQTNELLFSLFTNKEFVGGVILEVFYNQSMRNFINLFNNSLYINENNYSIKLMENYLLSTLTQKYINQSGDAGAVGSIAAQASLYISLINNPGSSFALRGLILTYLVQMLGYIHINFPPNSVKIFRNTKQKVFVKNDVIAVDAYTAKLPQIFVFYSVSPDFLNNVIDDSVQIFVVFAASFCVKILSIFIRKISSTKLINQCLLYFENYFFWNIVLSVLFSKYLIFTFYLAVQMTFKSGFYEGYDFLSFVIIFGFILLFPFHLLKILSLLFHINIIRTNDTFNFQSNKIVPHFPEVKLNLHKESFLPSQSPENSNKVIPEEIETLDPSPIKPKSAAQKLIKPPLDVLNWENLSEYGTPIIKKNKTNARKSKTLSFNAVLKPLNIENAERLFITSSKTHLPPPPDNNPTIEEEKKDIFEEEKKDIIEEEKKDTIEEKYNDDNNSNNNNVEGSAETMFYDSNTLIKSFQNLHNGESYNRVETQVSPVYNSKKWVENQPSIKIEDSIKKHMNFKIELHKTTNETLAVPGPPQNNIKKKSWRWIFEKTPLFSPSKIEKIQRNLEKQTLNSYLKSSLRYFKDFFLILFHAFKKLYDWFYKVLNQTKFKSKFYILWGDLKVSKGIHRYYFFFELVRYGLIGLLIVVLYNDPLTQITVLNVINLSFALLILCKRPFHSKINYIWSLFNELCINLSYIISFVICVLDIKGNQNSNLRLNLGWILVFAYLALFYSITANTIYLILRSVWRIVIKLKRNKVVSSNQ